MSTAQHSTAQHSTAQHKIAPYLAVLFLTLSSQVSAQNLEPEPVVKRYIGFSLGQTTVDDWCDDYSDIVNLDVTRCEDTTGLVKLIVGAKINRNFAVEASYNDFGEAGVTGDFFIPSIGETVTATVVSEVTGFNVSLLGIAPVSERLELFAKVGVTFWKLKNKTTFTSYFINSSESASGSSLGFGFGASINVSDDFAIRAEFEKVNSVGEKGASGDNDTPLSLLSIGFLWTLD